MTNEQKNQVAAMNASGMSIDEIVIDTGLDKQEVADFVAERNVKRKTISEQTKQAVVEWYQSGHTEKMCAKKFGISPASAHRIIAAAKEKEPTPAEAETSSKENYINNYNDTTKTAESQALESAKAKLLAIYETLSPEECRAWELGEVYAEVVRGCGE